MSEIDMEKRKSEILDRLATEILAKELAEERERVLLEEKRIAYEAEQQAILQEMSQILPELIEVTCREFSEFLINAGERLQELAQEYDSLCAKELELETRFRSCRHRFDETDQNEVGGLFNSVRWEKIELPKDLMMLLEYSFSNLEVRKFLSLGLLRFMDFRRRAPQNLSEINSKLTR
jgi:hypothetical protein